MDAGKIKRLLKKRCGRSFLGVFSIDRLPSTLPPRRPLLLVCNTDPHDRPGSHWIVMFIDLNGEFFDSFGQEPAPAFRRYLEHYCNSFTVNSKPIQSVLSAFCGHYAVFYCLMKTLNYSMSDIDNAFSSDTALNDYLIHRFVCDGL